MIMTLAELKRKLVIGAKVRLLERFGKAINESRSVVAVQTNGVYFEVNGKRSWLPFPKASDVKFEGNRFTIFQNGQPGLVYELEGQ